MHKYLLILLLLIPMNVYPQVTWKNAASVKQELVKAAENHKIFYSQFGFYEPRKSGQLKSRSQRLLQVRPLIYGVDFYYASGTWFTQESIKASRSNLITIVREAWRYYRAIPCFSWHLCNPYVPTGFDNKMGCRYRYCKELPSYPKEHQYVVKEILTNAGDSCGFGCLAGKNNTLGYKNPRQWFNARCQEVADIINQLVDEEGKPIPMIFRLWHEWEDNWMWWGFNSVSADDYKKFFILTEKIIKERAPKAEILWGYCPDRHWKDKKKMMSRYPGDDYVDIIGFDDYSIGTSEEALVETISRAKLVSDVAKRRGKVAGLFETANKNNIIKGFCMDYLNKVVQAEEVSLSFVQIWSTGKLKTEEQINDRREFVHQPNILIYH